MGWDVATRPLWGFTPHRGRGMALYGDKLISHSTDGMLFALDPTTGILLWENRMTDLYRGQQPSGAPVVVDGVIAMGYDCSADSSLDPCHASGYDAEPGRLMWRWYTSPPPGDPLHHTWGDDPQVYPFETRENMSPWMTPTIDTERGLLIFGIGSSAPQQPELAGTDGEWPDRLYQGSTVALDYRTGELVWWAQQAVGILSKLRTLIGAVFPPPDRLRRIYGLEPGSRAAYAYYLVWPITLLLRRGPHLLALIAGSARERTRMAKDRRRRAIETWVAARRDPDR